MRRAFRRHAPVTIAAALAALPCGENVRAQDVQPRVYAAAPVGVDAAAVSYSFSTGAILFDKTIPVEDVVGDVHSLGLSYARTFGLFDRYARLDVSLPWVSGDWEGLADRVIQTKAKTGIADPVLRFVLTLSGAPALQPEDYVAYEESTIVAMTMRVGVPLGQYDSVDLINLGSNRWWGGPQLGVSHLRHRFLVEAYAGVRLFSTNDAFLGDSELGQDPLYTAQLHVGYRSPRGLWVTASTRQSFGGATSIDGGEAENPESNNRVGVTFSMPFARRFTLRVAATTGLTATVGNDYDTFIVALNSAF